MAQMLIAVILSLCVMFCFCTLVLTFAMILRWVGVVMPGDQVQMPLLQGDGTGENDEEIVLEGELMETYPF